MRQLYKLHGNVKKQEIVDGKKTSVLVEQDIFVIADSAASAVVAANEFSVDVTDTGVVTPLGPDWNPGREASRPAAASAPFTTPQVRRLNEWQLGIGPGMAFHPFTCPNRGDGIEYDDNGVGDYSAATHGTEGGDRGLLLATPGGWVCPSCGYTQGWAHGFMAADLPGFGDIPGMDAGPEALSLFASVFSGKVRTAEKALGEYSRMAEAGMNGADVMVSCLRLWLDENRTAREGEK